MSPRRTRPRVLPAALVLAALLALPTPGHAAEDGVPVAQVLKQLDASLKTKKAGAVNTGLASVIAAHETADKAGRRKLLAAVARVLRKKDVELKSAALDAFEAIGDPHAWRHYGSLLRAPIHKDFSRIQSQAMDVTRALTPEGAVRPLLKILRKSKHLGAAAKALRTLGAFRNSKRRARILDEIVAAVKKEKPGIRGRDNTVWYGPRHTGEQARSRWQALAGPLVAAANELTGRNVRGIETWFQLVSENRRSLDGLFEHE